MSQILGYLVLAAIAARLCKWLFDEIQMTRFALAVDRIEHVAYREYRANRPIDRAGVVDALVGPPRLAVVPRFPSAAETPETLERLEAVAEQTRRAIGSVRLAEAMTPCDGVEWRPFFTNRDFGDETPAF